MSADIMIDMETLSTTADAVIVSIGAVRFDLEAGPTAFFPCATDLFSSVVDIDSQSDRRISAATLKWWLTQSQQAQAVFTVPSIDITLALFGLVAFVAATSGDVRVWSNGADFDLPMLTHACKQYEVPLPWKPEAGRCYRTYKNLPGARATKINRLGTHHNALDDAIDQAYHLCVIHAMMFGQQKGGAA